MIKLVPVNEEHLKDLVTYIRLADKQEIEKASGQSFWACLSDLWEERKNLHAVMRGGCLLGIGGWFKHENRSTTIFLITTCYIERFPLQYLRWSKRFLKELWKNHPVLASRVWGGNILHCRWLEWLGAEFGPVDSKGFMQFTLRQRSD